MSIIPLALVSQVNKKVETPGDTLRAILLINSIPIGPGPLGIGPTRPIALAPYLIANRASSILDMQQIFILIKCFQIFKFMCLVILSYFITGFKPFSEGDRPYIQNPEKEFARIGTCENPIVKTCA